MVARSNDLPLPLSEKHLADLKASGLTEEQIRQANYRTLTKEESKKYFGISQAGLGIPYTDANGKVYAAPAPGVQFFGRLKPDYEGKSDSERPKYLSPKDAGCRLYFSRLTDWSKVLRSAKREIWFTEGEKKADKACAEGFPTIGVGGVWAWLDRCPRTEEMEHPKPVQMLEDAEEPGSDFKLEDTRPLPELAAINFKNRKVRLCFDSDVMHNKNVLKALEFLARWLTGQGADVYVVLLPTEMDGAKNGLDDFLVRYEAPALRTFAKVDLPVLLPKVKNGEVTWVLNPLVREPDPHYKSVMASIVLRKTWAYRPGIGYYEWQGTHWQVQTSDDFKADIKAFTDAQGWRVRGTDTRNTMLDELRSSLLQRESCWDAARTLVFKNGTLDFGTNTFKPEHERFDYTTSCLPFAYDAQAECPTWLKFINEATGGSQPLVELAQAWMKYILMPKDLNRKAEVEKSLVLIGRRGTGKGTFLDVLAKLIGEENIGPASPETFGDEKSLAALLGKKLSMDTDASGFLANVGLFNKVVSNELVSVRKLYKDSILVRLGVPVVQAMNEHFSVPAGSEGLNRRLCVFPFNHAPTVIDPLLSQKLEAELPGIFAWAWQLTAVEAKKRILWSGSIDEVQEASIERFEANNPVFRFLMEMFPEGTDHLEGGVIQMKYLHQSYNEWLDQNGMKSQSQMKLNNSLQGLGFKGERNSRNCVVYQIPDMRQFDMAAHLGIATLVTVDGATQASEHPGDPGHLPDTSPDTSNACPDNIPDTSDTLTPNFSNQKEKGPFQKVETPEQPIEKNSLAPSVRSVRDTQPERDTSVRDDCPPVSEVSGAELIPPASRPLPSDPNKRVVALWCRGEEAKAAAQPKQVVPQPTLTVKVEPALRPTGEICLGMRVNKRDKTGWCGEVVEIVNDKSVDVLWSGATTSNRVEKSELKEDVRYRNT